jgi:arylsulfatase A-like enzyme
LDGRSLAPVIKGESESVRDSLFLSYGKVMRAVRDDRWKLIRYPHIDHTQLFDLKADPHEQKNLADAPEQAKRIERMTALMKQWQLELGDKAPLTWDVLAPREFQPPKP